MGTLQEEMKKNGFVQTDWEPKIQKDKFFERYVSKARSLKMEVSFADKKFHFLVINSDQFGNILGHLTPRSFRDEFTQKKCFLSDTASNNYEQIIFFSEKYFNLLECTREERRVFLARCVGEHLLKFISPEIHRYSTRRTNVDYETYLKYNAICDAYCASKFEKDDVIAALQKRMINAVKFNSMKMYYGNDLDELDEQMERCEKLKDNIDFYIKRIRSLIYDEYAAYWDNDAYL